MTAVLPRLHKNCLYTTWSENALRYLALKQSRPSGGSFRVMAPAQCDLPGARPTPSGGDDVAYSTRAGFGNTRLRKTVDSSAEAKFGAKVEVMPNGCWAYNGNLEKYGTFYPYKGSRDAVLAHRYAYELLIGDIPYGCLLHHECEHPGCVNPEHLTPLLVTQHQTAHALMRMTEPPQTTDEMVRHIRMLNRMAGLL